MHFSKLKRRLYWRLCWKEDFTVNQEKEECIACIYTFHVILVYREREWELPLKSELCQKVAWPMLLARDAVKEELAIKALKESTHNTDPSSSRFYCMKARNSALPRAHCLFVSPGGCDVDLFLISVHLSGKLIMQYVAEANYLPCCHIVSDLSLAIHCLFFYA